MLVQDWQPLLTHLCRRLQFFECVHDIHICYLEKFKKQEFEEKKFYYIPLLSYEAFQKWNSRQNHYYIVHNV
jgi:hypothetical protein